MINWLSLLFKQTEYHKIERAVGCVNKTKPHKHSVNWAGEDYNLCFWCNYSNYIPQYVKQPNVPYFRNNSDDYAISRQKRMGRKLRNKNKMESVTIFMFGDYRHNTRNVKYYTITPDGAKSVNFLRQIREMLIQ